MGNKKGRPSRGGPHPFGGKMTQRETVMLNFLEYLLDYSRRVVQRQIKQSDLSRLAAIRALIAELNREESKNAEF